MPERISPGTKIPLLRSTPEPNRIAALRARKRLDFGHVFRRSPDEEEVLASDEIVPKPVAILVELRCAAEMPVARSATSELLGPGNRHSVAVEVVGLGARGERQGNGEDRDAYRYGLQRSAKPGALLFRNHNRYAFATEPQSRTR